MSEADAEGLIARANATRVLVIGAGAGGLVAALECAKLGMAVTIVEAAASAGGALRSAEIAGLTLDVGAESFAVRGGAVKELVDELGLGDEIVFPAAGGAWVGGLPGGKAAPMPTGSVLGVPENPFAPEVRRIIGTRGSWRAYLDRVRPVLTIGHQHSLGVLVRTRMGDRVLDRLVAPVVAGVYSASPDDIDVDVAAPGLNAALTSSGSLSGAVGQLRAGRPAGAPGAAVGGLRGGIGRLVDALLARIGELGGTLRTGVQALSLVRVGEGWLVTANVADAAGDAASATPVPEQFEADIVVLACEESAARALLEPALAASPGPALPEALPGPAPRVDVVTLVIDAPALDAAPRGTGVLTVPGSHLAKALTHTTAKWPWVAEALRDAGHASRHVVRVSFGAQGEPPATAELGDADAARLALAEASALLGVPLDEAQLVGAHLERYAQSQPGSAIGQRERVAAVRAAVAARPGLGVVGAWVAGTGLAQVVPDAAAEADRVRSAALWRG